MKHTPDEDAMILKAALYALGTLTQQEARAFEEHVAEGCAACEAKLQAYEGVVAHLGFAPADEWEPPARISEKLSAYLSEAQAERALEITRQIEAGQLLTIRLDEGDWRETSEGVFVKRLFANEDNSTVTVLVKMLPGARGTVHRHTGIEECVVVEGDFHVDEKVLGPGDYHCAPAGTIHDTPFTIEGTLLVIVGPASYEVLNAR